MQVTLGGDRLGAGKKQKVDLKTFDRSTHDMSKITRTTMSAGTIVPIYVELTQMGDTWDIDLDAFVNTLPTIGPLFGSYKAQFDVFEAAVRLYQGQLHNNKLGIGMKMANVKLPQMELEAPVVSYVTVEKNIDTCQINPSCILPYLGIRGVGFASEGLTPIMREFCAIPLLMLWDTYKNYYANKQEEIGAVIHSNPVEVEDNITQIQIVFDGASPILSDDGNAPSNITLGLGRIIVLTTTSIPDLSQILINTAQGVIPANELGEIVYQTATQTNIQYKWFTWGTRQALYWSFVNANTSYIGEINVETFPLADIDTMRERILAHSVNATPFMVSDQTDLKPYSLLFEKTGEFFSRTASQEGLPVKTYQSDLFNNWISTEWIDGVGGINEVTAVDTSSGSFEIESLIMAKKVYVMLNQIAISGGSYQDWLKAVFTEETYWQAESPIYHGGLSKEIVFQEVISNSESFVESEGAQPLGTLAGKGTFSKKHKGGKVTIRVKEPSYIMILASITPRIDYSQGNRWHTHLKTMDDLHKPALDQIGFQELITEQMAWWDTYYAGLDGWTTRSAGKQPAWINYMTNYNEVYGNFATDMKEGFMILNRRYTPKQTGGDAQIEDLTTYIDPSKYNNIFAQTSLDSQNFWMQVGIDVTLRRKISAKVIPNI